MRNYSAFIPRFWITGTGKKIVREYGSDHVMVAVYLFTAPHSHMGGLYHCPISRISEETSLPADHVLAILQDLEKVDFIRYDPIGEVVWVVNMLYWQMGKIKEGDTRLKNVETHVSRVPDSQLIAEFCRFYGLKCDGASMGHRGTLTLPVLSDPAPVTLTATTVTGGEA